MNILLEIYEENRRNKRLHDERHFQLWLANHKEELAQNREESKRRTREGLEQFNSNLKVRVARLNALGQLYGPANAMLQTQSYIHRDFLSKEEMNLTVQHGPEFFKPFTMLNQFKSLSRVKLEVVIALYQYLYARNYPAFEKFSHELDLAKVNVISGWITGVIAYFLAGGIRATNTFFSLFECLPKEQQVNLISRKDREGIILNRFCGSEQNRAEMMMLRTLALRMTTDSYDSHWISEDSPSVQGLNFGGTFSIQQLLKDNFSNEEEKSIKRALSYFDDYKVNKDMEPILEQQTVYASVFIVLDLMDKLENGFFNWFTSVLGDVSLGKISPNPQINVDVLASLNEHFRYFESHDSNSELHLCMLRSGIDLNGVTRQYPDIYNQQLSDPLHFTESDFPTLYGFITKAVKSNNLGGDLAPNFKLEGH